MASYPTPDLVTALAPDAASLKAGRGLSSPGKWTLAGGNDSALWGLMQGSGKDPYQVQVLADGTATKCTCPSRKFPCKHAIGLLFIAAEQPGQLAAGPPPAWVEEWLASRAEKTAKAEAKAVETASAPQAPVDAAAQAKRREKRTERVAQGIAFLQQWLADLIRQGLADAPLTDPSFWENPARRMIDAQAPGLARLLRQAAASVPRGSAAAPHRLMDDLGRLHLLLSTARDLEALDPGLRSEVEQLVGFTVPHETVLAGPEVTDTWFVSARTMTEEDRVITAITWLRGADTKRWACWIQSAPVQQPVFTPLPIGRWVRGGLAFYPGAGPLRALWKTPATATDPPATALLTESIASCLTRYAAALAENPWRTHLPFCLRATTLAHDSRDWWVDEAGQALPLQSSPSLAQLMSAADGGRPVPVFGIWTGREAIPLAMEADGTWLSLTGGPPA